MVCRIFAKKIKRNTDTKKKYYYLTFEFRGKKFERSLKTWDRQDANKRGKALYAAADYCAAVTTTRKKRAGCPATSAGYGTLTTWSLPLSASTVGASALACQVPRLALNSTT